MRQRRFVALASFIVLGQLGNSIASAPLAIWAQETFQVTPGEFTNMNVVANVAGLIGAVFVGATFDRVDKRVFLYAECVFFVTLNFMPLLLETKEHVRAWWFFDALFGQIHFVVVSRIMVQYADAYAGASFFALTATISNFATLVGSAVGGSIAERWGPNICFYLGSSINVLMFLPIFFLTDLAPRRDLAATSADVGKITVLNPFAAAG